MRDTAIEWCDDTVNVVEGCTEVDTDCTRCYAAGIAARFSQPHQHRDENGAPMGIAREGHYAGIARLSPGRRLPQWTGVVRLWPDRLDAMFWRLLRARTPRRQFLCSMGDIFHKEVPAAFLDEVFARIAILESRRPAQHPRIVRGTHGDLTPWSSDHHPIYMLTKRPERAAAYTNAPDVEQRVEAAALAFIMRERESGAASTSTARRRAVASLCGFSMPAWPLRSVAIITSAGTQAGADKRVPELLKVKAAMLGVSCEPMTGPVDFSRWLHALAWLILGGESGDEDAIDDERRPRPCELAWLEDGVQQAQEAGVATFCKQLGNDLARRLGRPGKGGKLEDLPPHLRIRQFPRMPA